MSSKALPDQLASLLVGEDFAIFAVGKQDPVFGVEQDEAVRDRLEGGSDRASLPLRLIFQSLLLDGARPEKPERARHGAEFVPALRGDLDIVASLRQFPDDPVQPSQRADDRTKDEDREKRADQHHDCHQDGRGLGRLLRLPHRLVARGFRFGARVRDELVQRGVDIGAVGAGLGEQSVADDAVVLGVAVDGLQSRLDIGVHLGTDFPDRLRRRFGEAGPCGPSADRAPPRHFALSSSAG